MGKPWTKTVFIAVLAALAFFAVQDFVAHGPQGVFGDYLHRVFDEEAQDYSIGDGVAHRARTGSITHRTAGVETVCFPEPGGRVELRGAAGDEIRLGYEIVVYADRPEQAARYLPRVAVEKVMDDGRLTFRLREPRVRDEGVRGIRVNYMVEVPPHLAVDIAGTGEEITARGLCGALTLGLNGSARITGITGDVKVYGGGNRFETELRVAKLRRDLGVEVYGGGPRFATLEITGVKGNVVLDQTFIHDGYIADIDGNLTLDNHDGGVIVENIRGDLEAKFDGRLLVNRVAGAVRVEGRSGLLDAAHIAGPVTVDGQELYVNLRDIRGDTRVTAKSGSNVLYELPLTGEGYQVTAVSRPGVIVTATGPGRIVTDLPLTIVEWGDGGRKATGRVGNGRYRVDIETEASNIYLRSATVEDLR
ncbi:MAG: hypothetical protein QMC81_07155 [Thermoanaerobacterales bacterium]|nr:hypothetical protein [Thermoanaerobacterales bacterium]